MHSVWSGIQRFNNNSNYLRPFYLACIIALMFNSNCVPSNAQSTSDDAVRRANSRINGEAANLSDKYIKSGDKKATREINTWNDVATQKGADWNDQIRQMKNTYNYVPYTGYSPVWGLQTGVQATPAYSPQDIANVERIRDQEVQQAQNQGQVSAEQARANAQARAERIQQTASGLRSQFSKSEDVPGAAHLDPNGTNLYVRTYDVTSIPKPRELTATPHRLPTPILTHHLTKIQNASNP